jgi:hypothetical protein
VPDEAITSDTREPSYMFLAAEWNRSSVSERAYLLAMLFGREFEVEANDLSLQIASLAMTMVEPDGSAALIARGDLGAAPDNDLPRTKAWETPIRGAHVVPGWRARPRNPRWH